MDPAQPSNNNKPPMGHNPHSLQYLTTKVIAGCIKNSEDALTLPLSSDVQKMIFAQKQKKEEEARRRREEEEARRRREEEEARRRRELQNARHYWNPPPGYIPGNNSPFDRQSSNYNVSWY